MKRVFLLLAVAFLAFGFTSSESLKTNEIESVESRCCFANNWSACGKTWTATANTINPGSDIYHVTWTDGTNYTSFQVTGAQNAANAVYLAPACPW